ncbi:MAG: diadenylate cyclase CdaA [Candidatus Obscuribacterales bacterium]|nr:diadenylate cyclase CdaA [Candidatus Obscuribacterales bacterium]
MNELWHQLETMMSLSGHQWSVLGVFKMFVQFLIIGYVMFWTWRKIKGTQAERIVKGLLFMATVWIGCEYFGLTMITTILRELVPVLLICLVIVFQPELRRGLGYLGRTRFRLDVLSLSDTPHEQAREVISQIISAVRELSRTRTGALIVVEPPEGERDYVSPGTTLNAELSANLMLSIFNPTSPLHDGAVVVRQNKIIAAGVILPVTDNPKVSQRYGTRHRAALGLSEIYDGLCIVASEETGAISAANRGMLVRYSSADELADALNYIYHQVPEQKADGPLSAVSSLFARSRRGRAGDSAPHPRRRATDFPRDESLDQCIEADKVERTNLDKPDKQAGDRGPDKLERPADRPERSEQRGPEAEKV